MYIIGNFLNRLRIYIEIPFSRASELVVKITIEVLFPYILCLISFIACGNDADQTGATQEGFPYSPYLLSVKAFPSESTLMQGKHLRRSFSGHLKIVTAGLFTHEQDRRDHDRKVKAGGAR